MRLPKRIDFSAVHFELAGRCELRLRDLWGFPHRGFACVENNDIDILGQLKVVPWNRHEFLIYAKQTAPSNDQISDLPGLRICDEIVHAAQRVILRIPHIGVDQLP
jgi:hypothetical protein